MKAARGEAGAGPRRPLLATLAVAALVLAGCAGGDEQLGKDEYERLVRAEYANVQLAFQATRGGSGAALAERVAAAQEALRHAASELDGVAPGDVEEENELVVDGMRRYADDLDELREAADDGDTAAIEAFNRRLGTNPAIEQMEEAAEAMKFKGYDLGAIAAE